MLDADKVLLCVTNSLITIMGPHYRQHFPIFKSWINFKKNYTQVTQAESNIVKILIQVNEILSPLPFSS
jgi:hypothetical protein